MSKDSPWDRRAARDKIINKQFRTNFNLLKKEDVNGRLKLVKERIEALRRSDEQYSNEVGDI